MRRGYDLRMTSRTSPTLGFVGDPAIVTCVVSPIVQDCSQETRADAACNGGLEDEPDWVGKPRINRSGVSGGKT